MGRKPRIDISETGDASVRLDIPRPIWLLAEAVARKLNAKPETGMRLLIARLEGLVLSGNISWLGAEFEIALKAVREANLGVIKSGPKIDVSKLHRTDKTKSGYVGVYPNGRGFRAMGRTKGDGKLVYLGQYDSAEEAAWFRYCHYREQGLPYGEMEVEIDVWRARGELGTDEELKEQIIAHSKMVGTYHIFEPWLEDDDRDDKPARRGVKMLGFDESVDLDEIQRRFDAKTKPSG